MYKIAAIFITVIIFGFAFRTLIEQNAELKAIIIEKQALLNKIEQMQEINTQQLKRLENANVSIDKLESDLRNKSKRLYVKTVCPISKTSRMDDTRPTELARDAEQNYLRLLRQLERLEAQYLGLREYITHC